MQPEQIMSSDLLDILFADRNKMYGAYTLRREYNRRLQKALMITGALVCTALAFYYYQDSPESQIVKSRIFEIPDPEWKSIPDQPKPSTPLPPPRPKQKQVSTKQFTTLVIDEKATQPPPPIDQLINSQVGKENKYGLPDVGFPPPAAVSGNNTAVATPVTTSGDDDIIRDKVDIESSYPGGPKAWKRFLIKTFRYPVAAEENGIYGTVLIKFVVDKEGNVSGIQALSGPEELRSEAIRVISKSGRWTPAIQNGSVVNSYKYQQIVFQLSE